MNFENILTFQEAMEHLQKHADETDLGKALQQIVESLKEANSEYVNGTLNKNVLDEAIDLLKSEIDDSFDIYAQEDFNEFGKRFCDEIVKKIYIHDPANDPVFMTGLDFELNPTENLEAARKALEEKIAQLNETIEEVREKILPPLTLSILSIEVVG